MIVRCLIATVILTSIAADAAVRVNPRGLGEVLLFPHYNVNNGNNTLITVSNTTDRVKAIRVRFRESRRSFSVAELNLYLAPNDTWSAAVLAFDDTPAQLLTRDTSCVVPELTPNSALGAMTLAFSTSEFMAPELGGSGDDVFRSYDGFIEVIEMGEVAFEADGTSGDAPLGTFAIHDDAGVPEDCSRLVAAWEEGGIWSDNPQADMSEPAGGLYGTASIINVSEAFQFGYPVEAIDGFYDPEAGLPISLHEPPGSSAPDLNSAATGAAGDNVAADVLDPENNITRLFFDRPVDAVSAVLMKRSVANDFSFESVIGAETEWVVTLPTRQFYVSTEQALSPFTSPIFTSGIQLDGTVPRALEVLTLAVSNRGGVDITPPPNCFFTGSACINIPELSFASNAIAIVRSSSQSRILSNEVTENNFNIIFSGGTSSNNASGTATFNFDEPGQELFANQGTIMLEGLPVIGFGMRIAANGQLIDGMGRRVASKYGTAFKMRAIRSQPVQVSSATTVVGEQQ